MIIDKSVHSTSKYLNVNTNKHFQTFPWIPATDYFKMPMVQIEVHCFKLAHWTCQAMEYRLDGVDLNCAKNEHFDGYTDTNTDSEYNPYFCFELV